MCRHKRRISVGILSVALFLVLGAPAFGQRFVSVPVGTVVPLRIDTGLDSNSSRVGDRFTATVFQDVVVNGRAALPARAKVEGHVTAVTPADRGRAGTIAVTFDRLVLPRGASVPIEATLTALSEEGRRRIEQDLRNQERVDSTSGTRRPIVFLGVAGGGGTTIGVAGSAQTTTVGAILGSLLNSGVRAEVQPGTEFGMMVEQSFNVDFEPSTRADIERDNEPRGQNVLTPSDTIRSAQTVLRSRNYYNGPVNGVMNQATRTAIQNFQHDRSIPVTGEVDLETARVLGIQADLPGSPTQTEFVSVESIRFAQTSLRDRGYYTGPINGIMNQATRTAIRQLQRERNLTPTGNLDLMTARELGIASDSGVESAAIEIVNPRAERVGPGSIRISADVHTRGSGWQIFVNRFVTANTLHVYVRGIPPRYSTGGATDHHPFTETYSDLPNVTRVIIHGPQRDFAADLLRDGGGSVGAGGIGNPRNISLLANRLLQDFQRELNIRGNRAQVIFDTRRNFRPLEVEVLSQITSLQAAAELYSQVAVSITDPDAVKGAASGLMRQARLLERIMRRDTQLGLSSIMRNDWEQLQAELARITIADLDTDTNR